MSVLRQFNYLGQQRLDLSHLRSIESSIVADFDLLAGQVLSGAKSYVVKGLTISPSFIGSSANLVELDVRDALILHYLAAENGTIYSFPRTDEVTNLDVLDPSVNSKVIGSFIASEKHYIGIDLFRKTDPLTNDVVKFLDADTKLEFSKIVPTARVLDYTIYVSLEPFVVSSNILPIAIISTNASNQVTVLQDARPMFFSLTNGRDTPNKNYKFPWSAGRDAQVVLNTGATQDSAFLIGDKNLNSLKDWVDAVNTRLWEVGGGQSWYSATSDRDVKVAFGPDTLGDGYNVTFVAGPATKVTYTGQTVNLQVGETVDFGGGATNRTIYAIVDNGATGTIYISGNATGVSGSITGDTTGGDGTVGVATFSVSDILIWKDISILFANSAATFNEVNDATDGVTFLDGQCLYVDINRETDLTAPAGLNAAIADLDSLGSPTIPGSRFVLAWRHGDNVYLRDQPFEAGRSYNVATVSAFGDVRLYENDNEAFNSATPEALSSFNFDSNHGVPKLNSVGTRLLGTTVVGTDGNWFVGTNDRLVARNAPSAGQASVLVDGSNPASTAISSAALRVNVTTLDDGDHFLGITSNASSILSVYKNTATGTNADFRFFGSGRFVANTVVGSTTTDSILQLYSSNALSSGEYYFNITDGNGLSADLSLLSLKRTTAREFLLGNSTDFSIYSGDETGSVFSVDGATGDTIIEGALDLNGPLDVLGSTIHRADVILYNAVDLHLYEDAGTLISASLTSGTTTGGKLELYDGANALRCIIRGQHSAGQNIALFQGDPGGTTAADSIVYINSTAAVGANECFLSIADNGTEVFSVNNNDVVLRNGYDLAMYSTGAALNVSIDGDTGDTKLFNGGDLFIYSDASPGALPKFSVAGVNGDTKLYSGALLKIYSDVGATEQFTVDGNNGNTFVNGTLEVDGATNLDSTLDVAGDTTLSGSTSNNDIIWTNRRDKSIFKLAVPYKTAGTVGQELNYHKINLFDGASQAYYELPELPVGAKLLQIYVFGKFDGDPTTADLDFNVYALTGTTFSTAAGNINPTAANQRFDQATITGANFLAGSDPGSVTYSVNGGSGFDIETPDLSGTNRTAYVVHLKTNTIGANIYANIYAVGVTYTYNSVDNC